MLQRKISEMFGDQDDETTCGHHSFSKVILKNVFELLLNIVTSSIYKINNCNSFLNTYTIAFTPGYLNTLNPEKCSQGGYLKILLFLHLFFLIKTFVITKQLRYLHVSEIYSIMYSYITIPYINEIQHHDLTNALTKIKEVSDDYKIGLVTFHIRRDISLSLIKKITDCGLYAMLLIGKQIGNSTTRHYVTIVGVENDNLLIKNSWGYEITEISKVEPFQLRLTTSKGHVLFDIILGCSFVIPVEMETPENIEFIDDTSKLDEFLLKYNELKSNLQGVLSKRGGRKSMKRKLKKHKSKKINNTIY